MTESSRPIVSVVMAAYNSEQFIRQATDSVLNQTFDNFELIVVDDGSVDATSSFLDGYRDSRMVVLRNDQNLGQTRSLNRGLAVAKGKFIARHDADDISDPCRFAVQLETLQQNPSLGLLGTAYNVIDSQGRVLETITPPLANGELQERLLKRNCFCHGSVMLRREALTTTGAYNESFPVAQDYELWLRVSEHFELANLDRPLYQFRFSDSSVSSQKRELQLVYRQMAYDMALQRRLEGESRQLSESLAPAYEPDPQRLFKSARHSAYLHYLAEDIEKAANSLRAAQAKVDANKLAVDWSHWAAGRARDLAHRKGNAGLAAEFIEWVFKTLPDTAQKKCVSKTVARFYADQAFQAFEAGNTAKVLAMVSRAFYHDRAWLRDRGIWSICWKSLSNRN